MQRQFNERQAPAHTRRILRREQMLPDPVEQFLLWYDEAVEAGYPLPNAMTLATASKAGLPSARMVLLKALDDRGFIFFTNYNSPKGRDLTDNGHAALVFHWGALERQVRVTGVVTRATDQDSDAYFRTRSRGSRLAAAASEQSRPIAQRESVVERVQQLADLYRDRDVPRPANWGGFIVRPLTIEFWQGGYDRLHDRFLYTRRSDDTWSIDRLSP